MRVLTLDAALGRVAAGVVEDGRLLVERSFMAAAGSRRPESLATLASEVFSEGQRTGRIGCVGVVIGPGSFTGIRASLALAHGLSAAAGVEVVGVTLGEAFRAGVRHPATAIWTAVDSRRGRLFLETGTEVRSLRLDGIPVANGPVEVCGDAGEAVAAALRALGCVATAGERWPSPLGIAEAALGRLGGRLPPRPAQPLYVDPPAVTFPTGGLRPPPA